MFIKPIRIRTSFRN